MAEQEIRADPDFGDAQPLDEHRPHEGLGTPLRQLVREPHDGRAVHADLREAFELLRLRHQQRRRLVGLTTRGGCGSNVITTDVACARGDAAQTIEDLAVSAVQTVEIAEREHRIPPARRPRIVREVNDVHDYPGISITWPS